MGARLPLLSIALLSSAALAYEILLLQLFSIIQYHHLAAVIISLALLGYGMSGSLLFLLQRSFRRHYATVLPIAMALFGISAVGAFQLAQLIPFNGEELLWDRSQIGLFALICLLLSLPFCCCATAIGLAFLAFGDAIGKIYAADLLGAGLGSLAVIFLLFAVLPEQVLSFIGIAGIVAALLAVYEIRHRRRHRFAGLILLTGAAAALMLGGSIELQPSPYKSLPSYLRLEGTKIIDTRSSPLGLVTVLQSEHIPFRHAPGLSIQTPGEPLPQLGLFTNGDNLSVITRRAEHRDQLAYLDYLTSALPYHLFTPATTLILGSGGGSDILQARYHHIASVDAVEVNADIAELLSSTYADYAGHLIDGRNVRLHVADIRQFMDRNNKRFDLIGLPLAGGFGPSAAGLYAANANYLYTVQAFTAYLEALSADGMLSITRWLSTPPRDTLKIITTAVAALQHLGIPNPANHLVVIRSWQTSTVLVKLRPFSESEIDRVKTFAGSRSFDIAFGPTIQEEELNRFHVLPQPSYYLGIRALTSDRSADYIDRYKFNIAPATDNRPYFHHFFKWRWFSEILQLRGQGGAALLEYGYLLLLGATVSAVLAALLLILLPLRLIRDRETVSASSSQRMTVLLFFFCTGIAFLMVEIAFLQRFTLFLHHPVYSASLTIAVFLVCAGIGSRISTSCAERFGAYQTLLGALAGILLLGLLYAFTLNYFFAWFSYLPLPGKMILTALLVAPLALCMGMPFPLALHRLSEKQQGLLPWAWGVNGCASVISAMVTALVSIHVGFTAVILCALAVYGSLAFTFPDQNRPVCP